MQGRIGALLFGRISQSADHVVTQSKHLQAASEEFTIEVDGLAVPARRGQTIAAALMAVGRIAFRHTPAGAPRGIFCGMGVCFDCLVTVDGLADQRACVTPVWPGMRVHTRITEAS